MAKDSGKALSKSQIADHLAKSTGQTKRTAVQFLDDLTGLAYKEAKNSFTIPGVGKLVLVNRKARPSAHVVMVDEDEFQFAERELLALAGEERTRPVEDEAAAPKDDSIEELVK